MPRRTIGIDITDAHFHAVQLTRRGRKLHVEKSLQCPRRRQQDLPSSLLNELTAKHGFDRHAHIAVALPEKQTFYQNQTPQTDSGLQNLFPIMPNRQRIALCPAHDPSNHSLITATDSEALSQHLAIFRQAKLRARLVDAPAFALYASLQHRFPDLPRKTAIILSIQSDRMMILITHAHQLIQVRSMPLSENIEQKKRAEILIRETQITWRHAFNQPIPEKTPCYLVGTIFNDATVTAILKEQLTTEITTTDSQPEVSIAHGLALRAMTPAAAPGINMANQPETPAVKEGNLRKQVILTLTLLLTLTAMYAASILLRKYQLENQYIQIKTQMRNIFKQTLPQETTIVNELAQLTQNLKQQKQDYATLAPWTHSSPSPLKVLGLISEHTPHSLDLQITHLSINSDQVNLDASCDSWQTVDQWEQALSSVPGFYNLDVRNQKMSSDSQRVSFNASFSLSSSDQRSSQYESN